MNNSKKLQDDAARHRGFPKSGEQAWLEESEYVIQLSRPIDSINVNISLCSHKETVKKHLLTSHYYVCKTCGEEV